MDESGWARGRWVLLLAYGFIALSKLNRGFFDVATSCAVIFADDFGATFGLPAVRLSFVGSAVIAGTAAIEVAIPILLLRTRLRSYGMVVALAFHFVLAFDPGSHVWDFSAALLPLFLLFAPLEFRADLDRRLARFEARPTRERALAVIVVIVAHWVVAFGGGLGMVPAWLVAYAVWPVVAATVLVAAIAFLRRNPDATLGQPVFSPVTGSSRWLVGWLGAIIVLAAAIGIAPYLELRSAAAFNMYSNLRVADGRSNHFLVGSPRSSGDISDYVSIRAVEDESPLRYYVEADLLVPAENLDRYLVENQREDPLILTAGATGSARELGYGSSDAESGVWASVSGVLSRKLGFRRAVHPVGTNGCFRSWGPIG